MFTGNSSFSRPKDLSATAIEEAARCLERCLSQLEMAEAVDATWTVEDFTGHVRSSTTRLLTLPVTCERDADTLIQVLERMRVLLGEESDDWIAAQSVIAGRNPHYHRADEQADAHRVHL